MAMARPPKDIKSRLDSGDNLRGIRPDEFQHHAYHYFPLPVHGRQALADFAADHYIGYLV